MKAHDSAKLCIVVNYCLTTTITTTRTINVSVMTVSLLRHNSNYGGYSQAKQRRKVFFKTARPRLNHWFRQWFSLMHDTGVFHVPLKAAKTQSSDNDSAINTAFQVLHFPGLHFPPLNVWSYIFRSCIFSPRFSQRRGKCRKVGGANWQEGWVM